MPVATIDHTRTHGSVTDPRDAMRSLAAQGMRVLLLHGTYVDDLGRTSCTCAAGATCQAMGTHPLVLPGIAEHGAHSASAAPADLEAAIEAIEATMENPSATPVVNVAVVPSGFVGLRVRAGDGLAWVHSLGPEAQAAIARAPAMSVGTLHDVPSQVRTSSP